MLSWKSKGNTQQDKDAFIYSFDKRKIYRPVDPEGKNAVYWYGNCGPVFGDTSLSIDGEILNKKDAGYCYANDCETGRIYGVKTDEKGNNEITGEGNSLVGRCKFTCVECEVY